jgi:chromosome segregation ATPase
MRKRVSSPSGVHAARQISSNPNGPVPPNNDVRQDPELQERIGILKDVVRDSRQSHPKGSGAIESAHEPICAGNQKSARTNQLNRAGEASEKSNELHLESNQRIPQLESDDTKSKDEHLARREQREENFCTQRNDGSALLVQMNESVEPNQSGTAHSRRKRRRRARRRAQKREREQAPDFQPVLRPSGEATDPVNLLPDQQVNICSNISLSMNLERAARLRVSSSEVQKSPQAGNFQHCSALKQPEQELYSKLPNLAKSKQDRQPEIGQQKERENAEDNARENNRKPTENTAEKEKAKNRESELTCPTEVDLRDIVHASKFEMRLLSYENTELEQHVDILENKLTAAESAETELLNTNSHLNSSLSQTQSTNENLSDRIAVLEEQARSTCSDKSRLQQSIGDLTKKLRSYAGEKGALTRKVNLLGNSLVSCNSEKVELQRQVSEVESNRTADLVQDRKHRDVQAELIQMLEASNADVNNDLRSVTEKHEGALDKIAGLQADNDSLSTKVTAAQQQGAKLQSCLDETINKLHKATASAVGISRHNAFMKSEFPRLQKELQGVSTDLLCIRDKHNQALLRIGELTQTNARVSSECEELRQKATELQSELTSMTERHDKAISNLTDLHSRGVHLKSAHQLAESQVIRPESELSRFNAENVRKVEEVKQLCKRISILENESKDGKNQEDQLKADLSKRTADHVQAVNNVKRLCDRTAALEKARDEAQNTADVLQSELSNATIEQVKAVDEATQLKAAKTTLQSKHQDVVKQVKHLESELSTWATKHHQAVSKVNVLTYNNILLQGEVDRLKKEEESRARAQWEGGRDFKHFLLGS